MPTRSLIASCAVFVAAPAHKKTGRSRSGRDSELRISLFFPAPAAWLPFNLGWLRHWLAVEVTEWALATLGAVDDVNRFLWFGKT